MRKNRNKYIIVLLILCVGVAGCRSHKDLGRGDDGRRSSATTPDQTGSDRPRVERLDTIMNAEYSTLAANFRCKVQDISVNGQLRMAKDSIVWLTASKVVELGRVQLTPSRAKGYAKLLGKKYDLSYSDIEKNWGIDADFATLQALLTANCPPQCRKSKEPQRDGDTVTLWFTQGNGRQLTLKKDYATKRIVAADLQNRAAGQRIALTYSDWTTIDGQLVPGTIEVTIASRKLNEHTVVHLERIVLNQPQSYPFKM